MTILLTGAAGFIGCHTTEALLKRGDTVIGVDNVNDYYDPSLKRARIEKLSQYPNFSFFELDIADEAGMAHLFETNTPDTICHLAAQAGVRYSLEKPLTYINSNILGTTIIFEQARKHKIKHLVYASSSSVYGKSDEKIFKEDQRTDTPISLYAASKKECELIGHTYHHLFGIESSGLRFFTVYGPWGRPDMAAYLFATAIMKDEPIKLFNHGKMFRDFTYIDDIVRGVIASIDTPLGYQVFNLGGGHTTELEHFVALIEQNLGKEAKKELLPLQPGDVPATSADISKAKELLGWEPTVGIEEGIKNFCDWFRTYHA